MTIVALPNGMVEAVGACRECGKGHRVECPENGLYDWAFGAPIRVALPDVAVADVVWMASGVCMGCAGIGKAVAA